MDKTEAQIVSYGIFYLNPSSHQCQPSYKKYIAVAANDLVAPTACLEAINRLKWPPPVSLFCVCLEVVKQQYTSCNCPLISMLFPIENDF